VVRAHKALAAPTARRSAPLRPRALTSRIVRLGRAVRRPVRPVLAHEARRLSTAIGHPLLAATAPTHRRNPHRPQTATEATRSSGPTRRRRAATVRLLALTRLRRVHILLRNVATQRPPARTRLHRVHTPRLVAATRLRATARAADPPAAVAAAALIAAVAVRLPTRTTKSCLNTKARSAHPERAFVLSL
jgi:hypothetical protein